MTTMTTTTIPAYSLAEVDAGRVPFADFNYVAIANRRDPHGRPEVIHAHRPGAERTVCGLSHRAVLTRGEFVPWARLDDALDSGAYVACATCALTTDDVIRAGAVTVDVVDVDGFDVETVDLWIPAGVGTVDAVWHWLHNHTAYIPTAVDGSRDGLEAIVITPHEVDPAEPRGE